jgi:hypothetical protein
MTYCRWFQTLTDENTGILDYAWFSDEACFHLSGYVNSQNTRLWGSALFEEPLHSQKVGVFCALSQRHYDVKASKHLASLLTTDNVSARERALSQRRIIGPMFFDTTVTSQVYIEHTGGHFQHLM